MNNTPETITTLLHRQADQRAKRDVEEAMEKLWALFSPFKHENSAGFYGGAEKKWIGEPFAQLKEHFVEVLIPCYRNRDVREFVNKVESLNSQLEELRRE